VPVEFKKLFPTIILDGLKRVASLDGYGEVNKKTAANVRPDECGGNIPGIL
jgi:hypothetical protein